MNLAFSTTWNSRMGELAGQPTYFVEKILNGLYECDLGLNWFELESYYSNYCKFSNTDNYVNDFNHKLHAIREDPHYRWKVGNKIHFVINNRTPNRFQFAPVIPVIDEYRIIINPIDKKIHKAKYLVKNNREVIIAHGEELDANKIAINDGFNTVDDFFKWFYHEGKVSIPKIIHWTDLKY